MIDLTKFLRNKFNNFEHFILNIFFYQTNLLFRRKRTKLKLKNKK